MNKEIIVVLVVIFILFTAILGSTLYDKYFYFTKEYEPSNETVYNNENFQDALDDVIRDYGNDELMVRLLLTNKDIVNNSKSIKIELPNSASDLFFKILLKIERKFIIWDDINIDALLFFQNHVGSEARDYLIEKARNDNMLFVSMLRFRLADKTAYNEMIKEAWEYEI